MEEEKIIEVVKKYFSEIVSLRRHFHQNPELAFKEFETSKFIQHYLKDLGYIPEVKNKTGITADLNKGNTLVALRADMDALPIEEKTGLEFSSRNKGVMHACGHDAHMAIALGTAKILKELHPEVGVRFIFQPSEERTPGGAKGMIEEGCLEDVTEIFGLHMYPDIEIGSIMTRPGVFMAAADEIDIEIRGKGGHASTPQKTVDPIYLSGLFINAVQSIVSRKSSPVKPMVITISSIHGGNIYNIIPDVVTMKGTVRNTDSDHWEKCPEWIEEILIGTVKSLGGNYNLNYKRGYPILKNDPDSVKYLLKQANGIFKESIIREEPIMGGEDFSYYLQNKPGAFCFIGSGNKNLGITAGLHTDKFTIDENALLYGVVLFISLVMNYSKDR